MAFESTTPTEEELNVLPHIVLTSSTQWNPGEVILEKVQSEPVRVNVKKIQIHVDDSGFNTLDKYLYESHAIDDDIEMHEVNPIMRAINEIDTSQVGYEINDIPKKSSFISHERHNKLSAESLAENWCMGIMKAKATLGATTQHFKRSAILPISRRYRADRFYELKRLDGKFSTDTIWADVKSTNQHKYAQA